MLVGYARVSGSSQDHALQLDALAAAGVEKVFVETASGASKDRPELKAALSYLRPGDALVIWRLDRLSRSLSQLLSTAEELRARGIELRSLREAIDTSSPAGKVIFAVMGALAEAERDILKERVAAGIASARAKGRLGGRPRKFTDAKLQACKALLADGSLTVAQISKEVGISEASIWRYFPKAKSDAGHWAAPSGVARIPPILGRTQA